MVNLFGDAFNKTARGSILPRIGPEYSIYFKPKKKPIVLLKHKYVYILCIHVCVYNALVETLFTSIDGHVSNGAHTSVLYLNFKIIACG